MAYQNIDDVKRANKNAGGRWFDRDMTDQFGARVESELFGGKYWVESRSDISGSSREFFVAAIDDAGRIAPVDPESVYGTAAAAAASARAWSGRT